MSLVRTPSGYAIPQYVGYPANYVGVKRALGPVADKQGEWNLLKPVQATGGAAAELIARSQSRARASREYPQARPSFKPVTVERPPRYGYTYAAQRFTPGILKAKYNLDL